MNRNQTDETMEKEKSGPAGPMKEMTLDELKKGLEVHFETPESRGERNRRLDHFAGQAEFIVMFENLQLDSACCGDRAALAVGPGFTYETLDQVAKGVIGDVPSRFKYPVAFVDCRNIKPESDGF